MPATLSSSHSGIHPDLIMQEAVAVEEASRQAAALSPAAATPAQRLTEDAHNTSAASKAPADKVCAVTRSAHS